MPPSHAEVQRLKEQAARAGIWVLVWLVGSGLLMRFSMAAAFCAVFVAGMAFTWAFVRMDRWIDADTRSMTGQSGLR